MSSTNTTKMDAEYSWFSIYYENSTDGKADATVDPLEILARKFPTADRRLLRELAEDLRSTGPWVPRTIDPSSWHGAY